MTHSFAFDISPHERAYLARRSVRSQPARWSSTVHDLGIAFLAFAAAVSATLALRSTPNLLEGLVAILGWGYLALRVVPAVSARLRDALISTYGVATKATVNVDARGVTETIAHATPEQWGWDELRTIRSGTDGVMLEFRDGKACWIPARAFADTPTRDAFVAYADRMRRPVVTAELPAPNPERPVVTIPSGQWRWEVKADTPDEPPHTLILIDASNERNTLLIELDESDIVSNETIVTLACNPERRTWVDDDGVEWRFSFPLDDLATAVPARWPAGHKEPAPVAWPKAADGTDAASLPWKGLGHATHAELREWFTAQRARRSHPD